MAEQVEAAKNLALNCGFSHVGDLETATIQVRREVRESCAENKCKAYGTRWSCPPGCGTLEECEARIKRYRRGILLQTTGVLEDSLDYEGMSKAAEEHGKHMAAFAREIKALYPASLMVGAGACIRCETCTYPDAPCRFPDEMTASMEALGMVVSDVCRDNQLPYYYGPNTLTYVGCVLLF
jgi:predicted metal-binding protein